MGDSRRSTAVAVALLFVAVSLSADITVTSITPAAGLTRGGEIVHIHGTNLLGPPLACPSVTCGVFVKFGDTFGTVVDDTASEIVAIAPAHAAGRVDLQVNVPTNPTITLPSAYSYEDPSGDVRLLVPVAISAAGALGTNWQTDLVVHNENAERLTIAGTTIQPFASAAIALTPPPGGAGAFVSVPSRLGDNVSVNARVHDVTRDGDSWGVEIPAVPETQFRRSIVLLPVPTDARYRTLLRVYGYEALDTSVTAAFRDDATGELLGSRTLLLQSGYVQTPIDSFAGAHPRLRVQVTADSSLIWAFVSITNNVTQQVTTITPTFSTNAVALPATLANGHWGSNLSEGGVCIEVSNGGVSTNSGCAFGNFPKPVVGADGHFEADGTLVTGGVAQPGPPPPAHFSGVVQGTSMTLTARSGARTFGPWTVQYGNPSACGPICP